MLRALSHQASLAAARDAHEKSTRSHANNGNASFVTHCASLLTLGITFCITLRITLQTIPSSEKERAICERRRKQVPTARILTAVAVGHDIHNDDQDGDEETCHEVRNRFGDPQARHEQ